jgi:transitional endoplasmic reticulum ATPase
VRGGERAVRRRLEGQPLLAGDRLELSLLAGSVTVEFTVRETEPEGPVVVSEGTTIDISNQAEGTARLALGSVGYDDVGGLDEAVTALRETVGPAFAHADLFESIGGRPPNGVLLHGPTGSGKTLLARAAANETPATPVGVSCPALIDGEGSLRQVAKDAESAAPALVVLDDVDAFADDGDRTASLRSFVDRLSDRRDVVVLATLDDPNDLDARLRRAGRLSTEIELKVPDRDSRRDVLEVLTRGVRLGPDVDLRTLAEGTHGFVGADLQALVDGAVLEAVRRLTADGEAAAGEPVVTEADVRLARESVEPSTMREVSVEVPSVDYQDVGGLDDAKRELVRAVELPLRYPELFAHVGTTPPRGLLMYGPPGTGKTLLARAIASITDANFIAVDGPELMNKYVGESERAVREVFRRARQSAPSVVFFDEVDALAPARTGESSTGVQERVVSQFLTELDGLESLGDVVVIGATNRPDMIDKALLRPGRFEKVVEVPLPDTAAREEIFDVHTRSVPLDDVDLPSLAAATEGYTGSDIEAVCREASLLAIEEYLAGNEYRTDTDTIGTLRVGREEFDRALEAVGPSVTAEMRDYYEGLEVRAED